MPSAHDRTDFAPPSAVGSWRALGLALLVHVLLMAALTWGVAWKTSDQSLAFDAELWASTVQEAAPRAAQPVTPPAPVEPPPPPEPPAAPTPPPPPEPEPQIKPIESQVDIALEEEKKRKRLKQQQDAEAAQQAKAQKERKDKQEKAELLAKKEEEKKKEKEKAQEKAALEKQDAAVAQKKLAAQQQAKEQQAAAAAATEQKRQENIKRMRALAGEAGGSSTSATGGKGQADKSSGPSAGYGAKIRAKVLPNVVFTDEVAGNPRAEVEVTTTADGTILGQRLLKSSGNPAWDDAVMKALVRTGSLPRDIDGRVPSPMILDFRPKG